MLPVRKSFVKSSYNGVNRLQKCYNAHNSNLVRANVPPDLGSNAMNAPQSDNANISGLENDNPVVSTAPVGVDPQAGPQLEEYDAESLTPLQAHYLESLRQLIGVKNEYQSAPEYEAWMMDAIKRSIYSALRDCIEANIGDTAKELLQREHQVN